jgi:hypothetical protein
MIAVRLSTAYLIMVRVFGCLVRTSGAVEQGLPAEHLCNGAACRADVRLPRTSAVDRDRLGRSGHDMPDPSPRSAGQAAGQSAIPASGQRDDEAPRGHRHQ